MLDRINQRLKEDKIRVRVMAKGPSLYLRATLPSRGGEGNKQHKLKLTTTDPASADLKARELGELIRLGTFTWAYWDGTPEQTTTCGKFRAAARQLYDTKYQSETAWSKKWKPALAKLPPDPALCNDTVLPLIAEVSPVGVTLTGCLAVARPGEPGTRPNRPIAPVLGLDACIINGYLIVQGIVVHLKATHQVITT